MVTELKHLENSRFEMANVRWKPLICITDAERYMGEITALKAITGGDLLRMEYKNRQEQHPGTADRLVLIAANRKYRVMIIPRGLVKTLDRFFLLCAR